MDGANDCDGAKDKDGLEEGLTDTVGERVGDLVGAFVGETVGPGVGSGVTYVCSITGLYLPPSYSRLQNCSA